MRPATVVHVIHDLRLGGTERRLVSILATLDRTRFKPLLACVDGLGDLEDEVRNLGLEPVVLGRSRRWDPSGVRHLAQLVRKERAELLHGWLFLANAYARVGGRLGGALAVIAAEGGAVTTLSPRRERVSRVIERALAPLTSAYVANSAATADGLARLGAPRAKIEIVHNGVAPREELTEAVRARLRASLGASDAPLVTMVARLDGEFKDHEGFVRVIAALPGVRAAVVGDGPGRAAAEEAARREGVAERVVFTGFRRDAADIAAASDVSVLLTLSEGLSNVVLESMASAVPVVATDVPANREAIRDGLDGLLVPVGDVAATVHAVSRVLADRGLAERLGRSARDRAESEFSPEAQADRTMALYDRVLRSRRR